MPASATPFGTDRGTFAPPCRCVLPEIGQCPSPGMLDIFLRTDAKELIILLSTETTSNKGVCGAAPTSIASFQAFTPQFWGHMAGY